MKPTQAARADGARIEARFRAGETRQALAASYGVSGTTLGVILRDRGVGAAAAQADAERIVARWEAGETAPEIAVDYACSRDTVARILGPDRRYRRKVEPSLSLAEKRALPDAVLAEALERHGGDVTAAAAELGLARCTVRRRLGIVGSLPKPSMSRSEMVSRYHDGESIGAISRAAGCSFTAVRGRLLDAGVELRRAGGSSSSAVDRLRSFKHVVCVLYAAEASTTQIAAAFACNDQAVRRLLIAEGVALRPGGRGAVHRPEMAHVCRRAAAGRLVVEAGRLVPRFVADQSTYRGKTMTSAIDGMGF